MSLLIRSLGRVALVLPVLLMSAQLTFASDAKTAISESVQKGQPAPAKVTKKNAIGLTISKPDQVSSGGSTGTRGGNRNYVYFNVNNLSSTIYTEVYIRPRNSSEWIAYIPAGGSLVPGEAQRVTIPSRNTCFYDILLRNNIGDTAGSTSVNFCRIDNYNLRD